MVRFTDRDAFEMAVVPHADQALIIPKIIGFRSQATLHFWVTDKFLEFGIQTWPVEAAAMLQNVSNG